MKPHEQLVSFITRYVFAAVLGSAAIIAAAPMLRPAALPPWLTELSAVIRGVPALDRAANRLSDILLWNAAPTANSAPASDAASRDARPATGPAATAPARAAGSAPGATSGQRWAVVSRSGAEVYRSSGDVPLRLPAGTSLHTSGRRTGPDGQFVSCQLPIPGPRLSQPFHLQAESVTLYAGSLDAMSDETLSTAQQLARLQADLHTLRAKSPAPERQDNPHLAEMKRTREAIVAHQNQARALQQQFAEATGDNRMKLGDQLRMLKGEEIKLQQDHKAAKGPYDSWNAAHPKQATSEDPHLSALEKEIAALAAKLPPVAGIAP